MMVPIIRLPPNRVRRNYLGGKTLDALEGQPSHSDGERPEDWICSLVEARNPGMPPISHEGLSIVNVDGHDRSLASVFRDNPDYYLGAAHVAALGTDIGFLTKLLDSSMRLHTQAHPTREYAQRYFGKPWGKFEAYVILGVRDGEEGFIRLGFQHPPNPEEWLRIVVEQDITAMDACFEPVPVHPGEVWFVAGGLPHAIGGGLLVLEIMEPSDLVVRCEFEREGILVPPEARFMGHEPEEALRIFDYTKWTVSDVVGSFQLTPQRLDTGAGYEESLLLGSDHIDCFEVRELSLSHTTRVALDERFCIVICHRGRGVVSEGGTRINIAPGTKWLVAASIDSIRIEVFEEPLILYAVFPGKQTA